MSGDNYSALILRERKTVDITPDPMSRKLYLDVPQPALTDNRADVDRLRQELGKVMGPVSIDPGLMNKVPVVLRESGWAVTATVGVSESGWRLVDLETGDTTDRHYGIAIDIGTTTVVVYLVDMRNGNVLDVEAGYNGQIKYGDDILTRIYNAREEGRELLQRAVVDSLNTLVYSLAKRNGLAAEKEITAVSVGANTTMVHLFLGIDPASICVAPYIPVVNSPGIVEAGFIGLAVNSKSPVYIFPSVGSYLGGDVIAGVLACGMHEKEEVALLADIGTNGEFVLGNSQWMVACAGAAGPALEGGVAASGMRAEVGAIYKIIIDPTTGISEYYTIGDRPPLGICGSGLVDGIAELFLAGLIDRSGRYRDGRDFYVVVPADKSVAGRDIVISQVDISNFMRTKGAVNAAMDLLLENVGCGLETIERFYAAGAFGHHLDIESAVTLGLYPDLQRSRMVKVGNSSGEGARLALMSLKCMRDAGEIASNITYFELNASQEFMNRFVSSKFIPHTNMDYYPSVKKKLAERGLLK